MKNYRTLWTHAPIAVALVCLALAPGVPIAAQADSSAPLPAPSSAQVWLTDVPSNTWIAPQPTVTFRQQPADQALTIAVDAKRKYQKILGFGAAMTDSSGWLISRLSQSEQTALINALFSPTSGIGLNMIRDPMGATDLSASGNYTYDDMPSGESDPTLAHFSIAHDLAYIIPLLKQALALNPQASVLATPWSPPAWMKTNDSMEGGTLNGDDFTVLANYFVKFIQDYAAAGVPVSYVTPQNEPQNASTYPSMILSATQETQLIEDMGQAFAANHLTTKIFAWDHNWDMPSYPEQIYSVPAASQYAPTTAWHCYAGNVSAQSQVHNDYPEKGALITECSGGTWQGSSQQAFADEVDGLIIDGIRNWAQGVLLWNLALDGQHGPTNSHPGCLTCNGLVTIHQSTETYTYNPDYYALGQASKFVQVGAHRIYSNSFASGSIQDVAFENPDRSRVLIAFNTGTTAKTFSVAEGAWSFDYTLGAGDAVTFKWNPLPPGSGNAAGNVVDMTHDFSFSAQGEPPGKKLIVTYDPALLPGENAVQSGTGLLTYSLPYGASIQTSGTETALDRSGWTVSASATDTYGDVPANAIDGNLSNRWSSGHGQTSGDWFEIDLGKTQAFNQITLDSGPSSPGDYIRDYQVYVSSNGVNWGSAVVDGAGTGETVVIPMPTQNARYIRIVDTGSSGNWWSIANLNVYASSGTGGDWAAPQTVNNGLQLKTWTSPAGAQVTDILNQTGSVQTFPLSQDGSVTYSLPDGADAMFTTQGPSALAQPSVAQLSPNAGIGDQTVNIIGTHFGPEQGLGTVDIGANPATILTWSDQDVSALVPPNLSAGSVPVAVYGSDGVYAGTASFAIVTPIALTRSGWTATASNVDTYGDVPANMLDGNLNTRWSSGAGQSPGMWIEIDMAKPQTFNEIELNSGPSTGDYARSADVYVSNDGSTWAQVATITGDGPVEIATFATQTARYVKVINTGSSGSWWSIAEFNAYDTLSAPAQLTVSDTSSTATTLSWQPVTGADGYHVYENSGKSPVATVTGDTYSLGDLTPGMTYSFAVTAFNGSVESPPTNPVTVTTGPVGALPEVPFAGALSLILATGGLVWWRRRK
ncbi:MAG: discoidin domain-containing protein [Firmicutes bacterium]|nr:discoidin domain-containing protein [Bacillota bacterium]